jgi:hypothetical protein
MTQVFLYSIISTLYLITCGNIFIKNKKNLVSEVCKIGIFGSIILSFLSLLLNFFFPIDQYISSIIFLFFLIPALIYFIKAKTLKHTLIISVISGTVTTLIIILDNIYRPDAGLYHLPYTKIINENKIIFGVANIHFRFGHTSILQYLNAIYNNHLFGDNGILLPIASIFSLLIIFFVSEIYNEFQKNKIYSLYIFFIIAYILYGYNRYSEFGNDALGHILLLFVSSIFLKNIQFKENKIIKEIFFLSIFIFMNKPTLIAVFAIPFYFIISSKTIKKFINKTNFFAITFLLLWIIKNIITSGCAIYPLTKTCFTNLSWYSNDEKFNVSSQIQSLDNEAWTKGWPDKKHLNITQEEYVKRFTWLPVWSKHHGLIILKKLSIFILFLIAIDFALVRSLDKKILKKNRLFNIENKKLLYLVLISASGTLLWFLKFPIFRYGSSYIIIFLISLNIFIFKDYIRNINSKKIFLFFKVLIVLIILLFIFKNIIRIYKNFDQKYYNYPWPKIYSDLNNLRIVTKPIYHNNLIIYYLANQECHYNSAPCSNYVVNNVSLSIKKSYKFYEINK